MTRSHGRCARAKPAGLRCRFERGGLSPLLYLAPFLLFFAVFQIYPIFYGLYVSLTKWDLVTAPQFIGLTNYINLGKDTLFWTALRNTVLFVVLNAPLAVIIPLSLAMLVNNAITGRALFRSAFTTPLMISVSSVGVLWVWFLNPTFGLINALRWAGGPAGAELAARGRLGHGGGRAHHRLVDIGLEHGAVPGWPAGDPRAAL